MKTKATARSVSLYPDELEQIEKVKKEYGYRKFSQAVQHIVRQYGKRNVKVAPIVEGG